MTVTVDRDVHQELRALHARIQGMALGQAAVAYAQAGVPVFPLQPGSKVPFRGSRGVKDATTDAEQVRVWWERHPDANVGGACGVAFKVLDVDVKGANGWCSLHRLERAGMLKGVWGQVQSPSRGRSGQAGAHFYFPATVQGGNHTSTSLGLDFRGEGGYVVLPPSRIAGQAYRWVQVEDHGCEAVFSWDAATTLLGPVKRWGSRTPERPRGGPRGKQAGRDGIARRVREAKPGERNQTLFWGACRYLEEGADLGVLRAAAEAAGMPAWEIDRTLKSAERRAR